MNKNRNRMNEIRKLLGNEYHLCEIEGLDEYKWTLYKKYDDYDIYFSNDNKAIMSSDTSNIDELYEFAKKQHQIDEHRFIGKFCYIITWIIFVLMLINIIFLHNAALRWFFIGIDFMVILYCIVSHIIWDKNLKAELYIRYFFIRKRGK